MTEDYPSDIPFEVEYGDQKRLAAEYQLGKICDFRTNIYKACKETYYGRRSVSNFVDFASAVIKDENEDFKPYKIPMKELYFNSIKSFETEWEILRERATSKPELNASYKQYTETLKKMINGLVESNAISTGDCKIHLTVQLLFDCGIVANKILFERRLIRLNTALLYKQDKYNLIREANDGYSSLFNDLTAASIDNERDSKGKLESTPMDRIPQFLKTITSHMGVFHLDPNRVLDIILDFFIRQLKVNYKFWVELIKRSDWIEKLQHTDLQGEVTVNPSAIMGQLFGFRFHNYHYEEITPAPKELYLAIAILLKNNLILLGDILPYLSPCGEEVEEEKKDYIAKMNKEITSNSGGKLAMYGALGEEGTTQKVKRSAEKTETEEVEKEAPKKKYEANDVVELVKALFSIGDLKNASLMLAEYDKLIDTHPQLAYDIYRLCRVVLQPAYDTFVSEATQKLYSHFNQCAEKSQIISALLTQDDPNPKVPTQIKLKRVLVTDALLNDSQDLIKKERYVFFYKEWRDDLQLCTEVQHLTNRFLPLMRLAGYRTYLATDLIQKLTLVVGGIIEKGNDLPNGRLHCTNMFREILLPAISFSQGNLGTMASIWEVLCRFTFQERYSFYGEWFTDFYKKSIETKLLKARTERSVKYVLRRISKNDVRRCGRDLGKLAHSNPTIVFNVMLDQVQQFDNMAPMMADACRYLGDFAYDVLGYVLGEKWTGSQGPGRTLKTKEKDDGMPSTWIRALSVFSGMLFKKQDIDATPLLRYIACRLRYDDAVADLIILNEFVTKMGGMEILASACTEDQITAAGCSDALKTEAFLPISPDNRRASRRVLNRLKESLRRNNVGFEILVLLYRLEEACLAEKGVPAADRCSKLDRIHQSQTQYFELITSLFEGEEYEALVPNVDVLVNDYGLPIDVAMNFNRPKTRYNIKHNIDTPIVEGEVWEPFKQLSDSVATLLPDPPLKSIFSSEFYAIFWQLSLYDIYCPESHYEAAIKRHTEMIRQCQDTRSSFYMSNRPSVVSKAERQAQSSLEILREDLPKHKKHVEKILAVLKDSKIRWFPVLNQRQEQIQCIMQYCLLPRTRLSEVDAAFCYEFTMLMHRVNTPNFSSLTLFDKMLSENLPANFLAFSEYETTIYCRFIFKTFARMHLWHNDEKLYVKEAHGDGLIGFQKNWNAAPTPVAKEDLLSFSDFQRVLHKWHFKSTLVVIEQALKSGEAHSIKNAFLVLRQFMPCFPAVKDHGNSIIKIVKKLSEEEKRGNIKVLARSYIGLIAKYKSKWMSKESFLGLKELSPPVEIKIAPPANESSTSKEETSSSSKEKTSSSSNGEHRSSSNGEHHSSSSSKEKSSSSNGEHRSSEHREESSRNDDRKREETKHTSSSTTDSPTRRNGTEDRSIKPTSSGLRSSSLERKRSRDQDDYSREKSSRLRPSSTTTSRRDSPRDNTKESTSRTSTPLRTEERTSSLRTEDRTSSLRTEDRTSSLRTEDRTSRSTRPPVEPVSSSRHDDRMNGVSSSRTPINSSSSSATPRSSSTKRPLEDDRERDRHEKRRDVRDPRDDRSRTERLRIDDRRDDRRRDDRRVDDRRVDDRRVDDRRVDDRRIDDRRERERRDHRRRR